jgi:hypothetical protein
MKLLLTSLFIFGSSVLWSQEPDSDSNKKSVTGKRDASSKTNRERPGRVDPDLDGLTESLNREEMRLNSDGTIAYIKNLPNGEVRVNGKVLSAQEFKKWEEIARRPSGVRAKVGSSKEKQVEFTEPHSPGYGLIAVLVLLLAGGIGLYKGLKRLRAK